MSKFMRGSALLEGNDTTPGCHLTEEEKRVFSDALGKSREYGLDFYPTIIQKVRYDEMSEIAAYGGFPHRYPHWYWGMQYEELQRGYEYNQHRIYELVVNCMSPNTRVLTNRGTLLAKDVIAGDEVYLNAGRRKVFDVFEQEPAKTKIIKIDKYALELVSTYEHKWRVLDSQKGLVWKESQNINEGDILVGSDSYSIYKGKPFQINWTSEKIISETKANVRNRLKEFLPPSEMTVALAELLGIVTGDGSVGVKGQENGVSVSVGKDNREYAEYVLKLFDVVFDLEGQIYEKPSCYLVDVQSKVLVDLIDYLGLPKGCTYVTKRIPTSIWQSSQEFRAAYLKGLFDTDGYATDVLGMSCYNEDLAADVQLLLAEMGIASKFKVVPNNDDFINVIQISGQSNLKKFRDRIGFSIAYKLKGLNVLINREFCQGKGLEVPYIQKIILKWAEDNLERYDHNKNLCRSWDYMKKRLVGLNCLYSFVKRAEDLYHYNIPGEIHELLETPLFVVKEVLEGEKISTVDIALEHQSHDFVANGLITHNTNPCVMYIMASNTLLDNVTVVFHATGHNDFFKNNIFFTPTDENMMNKLASHATRIRKYIARWGRERVTEFIDHVLRVQTLIDPAKAWTERVIREPVIKDRRDYEYPRRLKVANDRMHMDPWINPKSYIDDEYKKIEEHELAKELELFQISDKDIFGFLKDYAHLKPWQQDIISMLYEEAMYFSPQRATKTINEGWASMMDYEFMTRQGFCALGQKTHDMGIVEYAVHKMGVLGGKYSVNPYKTGFYLFLDIEERWNKGQFGADYEECKNMRQKEEWDTKTGLGKQKIFEVRKYYNDVTFINEFFTQEFCDKFEYFEYKHYPNGEWKIESRDCKSIKRKLLQKHVNGGLPDIRIADPNHRNKNYLLLQHYKNDLDDRNLYEPYARAVLTSIHYLWNKEVMLVTKDNNGEEYVYVCVGSDPQKDVALVSREEYEKTWT